MKRRKTDQQIEDELHLANADALKFVVSALRKGDFGLLLEIDEAMTQAYELAISEDPGAIANREFQALQAFRRAKDHQRHPDA